MIYICLFVFKCPFTANFIRGIIYKKLRRYSNAVDKFQDAIAFMGLSDLIDQIMSEKASKRALTLPVSCLFVLWHWAEALRAAKGEESSIRKARMLEEIAHQAVHQYKDGICEDRAFCSWQCKLEHLNDAESWLWATAVDDLTCFFESLK